MRALELQQVQPSLVKVKSTFVLYTFPGGGCAQQSKQTSHFCGTVPKPSKNIASLW